MFFKQAAGSQIAKLLPPAINERKKMLWCERMAKGEPYADSGKKL
jgi:hypothetical protein